MTIIIRTEKAAFIPIAPSHASWQLHTDALHSLCLRRSGGVRVTGCGDERDMVSGEIMRHIV